VGEYVNLESSRPGGGGVGDDVALYRLGLSPIISAGHAIM
jgi:hypothetical protein